MKIILIDGEKINGISDIHNIFMSSLNFPDYYGENLDALYDMLTEKSERIIVISANSKLLGEKLKSKWEEFNKLMTDLEREKKNICFIKGL